MIGMQLTPTGIDGMKQRQVNRVFRNSMHAIGVIHHERYTPKHFTKAGAREYHYGARKGEPGSGEPFKGSYTAWKQKKKGHTDPLVKSGRGKREALSQKKVRATATRRQATATLSFPRIFNLRNPRSKTNPPEEMKRVSRQEHTAQEAALVKVIEVEYEKEGRKTRGVR